MPLSKDLISKFVKVTNDDKKTKKESTVYGTVIVDGEKEYLHIDGSYDQDGKPILQPLLTTVAVNNGNRVIVSIKNHMAVVTGNLTTRSTTVEKTVTIVNEQITDKLTVNDAEIEKLKAKDVEITGTLQAQNAIIDGKIDAKVVEADYAKIKEMDARYGEFNTLKSDYGVFKEAYTEDLKATEADIEHLEADTAHINEVMFGSAAGEVLQTTFANAVIALLGDAQIKSAMIESLNADKINAGSINTNKVNLTSEDGSLTIFDNLIQIKDGQNVRIQIGKDASGNYSILICDANGATMFDANGITENAIKEAIIVNDMIADDANISGSKIDIDSLITSINENGSTTIKSSKVYLDTEKQSLDVAFKELSGDVTANGTQITALNDKITSKVWMQDINNIKIGGRNLAVGTSDQWADISVNAWSGPLNHTVNGVTSFKHDYADYGVVVGDQLTFAVDISAIGKQCAIRVDYRKEDGTTAARFGNYIAAGTTGRSVITLPVTAEYIGFNVYIGHNGSVTETITQQYKCLKIEKGNKATDWTPAPEDFDADVQQLSTKYSLLEQDVDSITSTVSNHTVIMATKDDIADMATKTDVANDLAAVNSKFEHDQLVVNGGGEMGNNTNFSQLKFDGVNTHNSAGSFTRTATNYIIVESDEKFLVTPQREYTLSVDVKSKSGLAIFYAFIQFYDIDGLRIDGTHHTHNKASTTTLARDLNPGDTVIYLSDLSGWDASGSTMIAVWDYANSHGYTYPPNTYTRHRVKMLKDSTSGLIDLDLDAGTITLAAPYSGNTIPAGTYVSQQMPAATYKYLVSAVTPPTDWKNYSGKITGLDETGTNASKKFPPGTAYATVGFLWNYNSANDQLWVTNISVRDTTELSEVDQRLTTSEASAESLGSRLTVTESTIQQLADRISMLVTDGNGTSLMTQTEDGWTFSTAELESTINKTSEDLSNLVQQCGNTDAAVEVLQQAVSDLGVLSEYVKIGTHDGEPCIELGEGDSNFKLLITNTRIMFMDGSDIPAYINNKSLYIKKAVIEEELHQGGYAWVTRSNGHLSLVWKGVTN